MPTESVISNPRIDRKFCDANGNLTQNAYALLHGLVRRTGGAVAGVLDADELEKQIAAASEVMVFQPASSAATAPETMQPSVAGSDFADITQPSPFQSLGEVTWQS